MQQYNNNTDICSFSINPAVGMVDINDMCGYKESSLADFFSLKTNENSTQLVLNDKPILFCSVVLKEVKSTQK